MSGQPVVIATLNRKGGVGKTSTVHHVAGALAARKRRVLVVDMDPQGSLTQGFLGPAATESLATADTVAAIFDDRVDPDPARLIHETGFDGISLIPANDALTRYNAPETDGADRQWALRSFLKESAARFDIVLIDCPPNLQLCSWASLLAARFVVVPLQCEDYGAQGIIHVQRAIDTAVAKCNPALRLMGYLVTMFDKRLGIHRDYRRELGELYGDMVFEHPVPMAKDFKEAISARKPVTVYRPKSTAATAIQAVAGEMVQRIRELADRPAEFLYLGNRAGPREISRVVATGV
jgi:chromosome partitioning protein